MERYKISVIIPVYNVEKFLPACIESILIQHYFNWELILIDDGSLDRSGMICDQYAVKDKRIKVIHKRNQGVAIARNYGLNTATGDYVCCVDSDDTIDKDLFHYAQEDIEKQVDCIVYGYERIRNHEKQKIVLDEKLLQGASLEQQILYLKQENMFIPLWNKMYKRSVIESLGLRNESGLNIYEDLIFNQKIFHTIQSLSIINKPLYHYVLFSSEHCLSKKKHDPHLLLELAEVIKESDYQKSKILELAKYDKFFYWSFIRLAFLNSLKDFNYDTQKELMVLTEFINRIKGDMDYKEYAKTLGGIKYQIYRWQSKYLIYLYHKLYNVVRKS